MKERTFLSSLVGGVTVVTALRLLVASSHRDPSAATPFLLVCLLGQAAAMQGLRTGDPYAVRIGHVTFTTAMAVGCVTQTGWELGMVSVLSLFTWVSRRVLGHCMFSHARGATDTNDARYDALYAIPFLVSAARLARPGVLG